MQRKFTRTNFLKTSLKATVLALALGVFSTSSFAQQRPAKSFLHSEAQQVELKRQIARTTIANNNADNDAGLPSSQATPITNSPEAVCTTFTASITSADPTTNLRAFRGGVPRTCAAPGTCAAGLAGTFRYKIFEWTNPVAQCVTITYTANNANFSFVSVYNAPPTLTNLCTNWVADPGSSATVGTPIVFSFNATAGTTYYFLVTNITTLPADCTIQIDAPICFASPCTGTPAPGNTIASSPAVCPSIPVNLSLQNTTAGSGVTYQWQSSSTLAGPYTNVATGGTNSTYSTTVTANTYFRAQVTCSGNTGTSTPVLVNLNPPSQCYCAAGATSTSFEKISNFTYAGINRTTTSTAGYENWLTDTARVIQGAPNQASVTISGPFSSDEVRIWADLNQDGDFTDAGELLYVSPRGVGPHVATLVIPLTSNLGFTRLRVRMHDAALGGNATSCGNSTYGQVEDYTLEILPCVQGVFTAQPVNRSIQCGSNTTFAATVTGSAITYQWQVRTSTTAPWTNVANGGIYSGATTNTLTLTNASATVNNYQYRVVINGACTATDFSNLATLTITPLVPTTNVTSATICNGQIQQLSLTNLLAPSPAPPTTVSSGPISILVPDNIQSGITATLPVTTANIPTGAQLTGISVSLTMPHTWIGDMVFVLRAPNGQIVNLDYYLSGTGAAGAGLGFVNTNISSAGTALLSTGTPPYTATFRADLASNAFAGPTGMLPTATTWAPILASAAQGNWVLGMYDGGAGDVGTLTSWSITFNYMVGSLAQGTWAPLTGLYTDAAATIPYTGTVINTVYAKPTASTNYTVSFNSSTPCTSSVLTIPITVNTPVSNVSTVANAAACIGSSATFSVTAQGGTIGYQWQVSTDGGTTWTNITNGATYAGVTTNNLTVSNITAAMSNYRYRAVLTVAGCGAAVNTNAATLTANPNPVIVLSANPSTALYPGITTTLTAAVSPNAAATYTWFRNGVEVAGATGNTLVVNVDQLGEYTVRVNDVNSCSSTSASLTIRDSVNTTLFIYPSPNTGQFQVRYHSLPNNTFPRYVNIYDNKGARVYSRVFSVNVPYGRIDVDVRNFGKGIYRVELSDRNGVRIKTGSVIVL